jgi:hypothetical protein
MSQSNIALDFHKDSRTFIYKQYLVTYYLTKNLELNDSSVLHLQKDID